MNFIAKVLFISTLFTLLNLNIVNGLQCYLCFGCSSTTTASIQNCQATQTFCYTKTHSTNTYVEKGCIDKCVPGIQAADGANLTCCNTALCNYDNTVVLPTATTSTAKTTTTTTTQSSLPTTTKTTTTTQSPTTTKTTTTTQSSTTTKTTTTTQSPTTTKTTTTTQSPTTTKTTTTTQSPTTTKTTTTTQSPTTTKTTTTTQSPTTTRTTTTTQSNSNTVSTTKNQTNSPQLTLSSPGKPNLQCYFCIGCNNTNIPIILTCSANDTSCFTQTYSTFTQIGCSSKCTSGIHPTDSSYITCCNTSLCNTYQSPATVSPVSSNPNTQSSNRPPTQSSQTTYYGSYLECYSCNDCLNNNNIIESCYADQRYCYKEVNNNYVRKGCASSCTEGLLPSNARVYCCTGNRCNNADKIYKLNLNLIFVSAFIGLFLKYF